MPLVEAAPRRDRKSTRIGRTPPTLLNAPTVVFFETFAFSGESICLCAAIAATGEYTGAYVNSSSSLLSIRRFGPGTRVFLDPPGNGLRSDTSVGGNGSGDSESGFESNAFFGDDVSVSFSFSFSKHVFVFSVGVDAAVKTTLGVDAALFPKEPPTRRRLRYASIDRFIARTGSFASVFAKGETSSVDGFSC